MKAFTAIILVVAHFIFLGAGMIAAVDFGGTLGHRDTSTWTGFIFVLVTSILGLPWSIALFILGAALKSAGWLQSDFPWFMWIGFFINYLLLIRLSVKTARRISSSAKNE